MTVRTLDFKDKFGEPVGLGNGFILYRNRSIPFREIKEIRVKGNRFFVNHFTTNTTAPRMCVFFEDAQKAKFFHEETLSFMFQQN